jgi:hypothetical protein
MNILFGKLFGVMAIVAVIYLNYHAIKDSVPFLRRQLDRVIGSKIFTKARNWVGNVTQSNIVQGTKSTVSDAGGRVVHMFKRSKNIA